MTLKQLRVAQGLSQTVLATMICVKQNQLSTWERGRTVPCPKNYDRLVEVLGDVPDDIPRVERRRRPIGS